MFSTLHRYVLGLWFAPFFGMFILVNAIFLLQKVTIWLPKLVEHEAPAQMIALLFVSMMPVDMTMTIPIAFFFALVKLVRDLQTSSELDAMYAGGLSLFDIFKPVFWAAIALTLLMFVLTMELAPMGRVVTHNTALKLSSMQADVAFEPKQFITDIDDVVFYFEGKHQDGSYQGFMLADSRDKLGGTTIYFADRAMMSRVEAGLALRLYEGRQLAGEKGEVRSTVFTHYDMVVPLKTINQYREASLNSLPVYMDGRTLFLRMRADTSNTTYAARWHFRLVRSLSVVLLFLFAIVISIRSKRSKQGGVYLWAILIMWAINQAEVVAFKNIELAILPWWSLWVLWGALMMLGVWMFSMVSKRGVFQFSKLLRKA